MTFLGRLLSFFPIANLLLVIASVMGFVFYPSLLTAIAIPVSIYGVPLACFHIHRQFFPIKQGLSSIVSGYSPWYGAHMIQGMLIAFPGFERVLRLIPGAFTFWLRLWGAEVGNHVYWTPQLELLDRSLLKVGDNCVFGYNVKISGHVVTPNTKHGLVVYVKKVVIGSSAFIGAESRIGPGVTIESGVLVAAGKDIYPNAVLTNDSGESETAKPKNVKGATPTPTKEAISS